MSEFKTVMFHRDGHWHVGWLMDKAPDVPVGMYRVGWVKDGMMLSKLVDEIHSLDIPATLIMSTRK